jgi:hypothetical protein
MESSLVITTSEPQIHTIVAINQKHCAEERQQNDANSWLCCYETLEKRNLICSVRKQMSDEWGLAWL